MTQRKRSIGMYCGGAAVWGAALIYFVAFSHDRSDRQTVRAAEPPVPVAVEDSDDSIVSAVEPRSRASRLLDAIRPSRLLRRKTEQSEPQRLDPAQTDATSAIPMRRIAEQPAVKTQAAGQAVGDQEELPFEVLQTAADQSRTGYGIPGSRRNGDGGSDQSDARRSLGEKLGLCRMSQGISRSALQPGVADWLHRLPRRKCQHHDERNRAYPPKISGCVAVFCESCPQLHGAQS